MRNAQENSAGLMDTTAVEMLDTKVTSKLNLLNAFNNTTTNHSGVSLRRKKIELKFLKTISVLMLLVLLGGCSSNEKKFDNALKRFGETYQHYQKVAELASEAGLQNLDNPNLRENMNLINGAYDDLEEAEKRLNNLGLNWKGQGNFNDVAYKDAMRHLDNAENKIKQLEKIVKSSKK